MTNICYVNISYLVIIFLKKYAIKYFQSYYYDLTVYIEYYYYLPYDCFYFSYYLVYQLSTM